MSAIMPFKTLLKTKFFSKIMLLHSDFLLQQHIQYLPWKIIDDEIKGKKEETWLNTGRYWSTDRLKETLEVTRMRAFLRVSIWANVRVVSDLFKRHSNFLSLLRKAGNKSQVRDSSTRRVGERDPKRKHLGLGAYGTVCFFFISLGKI